MSLSFTAWMLKQKLQNAEHIPAHDGEVKFVRGEKVMVRWNVPSSDGLIKFPLRKIVWDVFNLDLRCSYNPPVTTIVCRSFSPFSRHCRNNAFGGQILHGMVMLYLVCFGLFL